MFHLDGTQATVTAVVTISRRKVTVDTHGHQLFAEQDINRAKEYINKDMFPIWAQTEEETLPCKYMIRKSCYDKDGNKLYPTLKKARRRDQIEKAAIKRQLAGDTKKRPLKDGEQRTNKRVKKNIAQQVLHTVVDDIKDTLTFVQDSIDVIVSEEPIEPPVQESEPPVDQSEQHVDQSEQHVDQSEPPVQESEIPVESEIPMGVENEKRLDEIAARERVLMREWAKLCEERREIRQQPMNDYTSIECIMMDVSNNKISIENAKRYVAERPDLLEALHPNMCKVFKMWSRA